MKFVKTIRTVFYTRFEIHRHVTWTLSLDNLKGPGYEPGAFVDMMIKKHFKENTLQKRSTSTYEEEMGIRHAALVHENMYVRDHLLAHFKSSYMPKDTQYTSGAMLKLVMAVNRCAFALNNISHRREYDSIALLFDAARKSGRSFDAFCFELENISCLQPNSAVIAAKDIPLLRDITRLFGLYNPTIGNEEMGGMNVDCPNNVLFVDIDSVHKSLVSESLIWRFVLKRNIGGENLRNYYKKSYIKGVPPFNLCQEFPGIFGILTHFF